MCYIQPKDYKGLASRAGKGAEMDVRKEKTFVLRCALEA